MVPWSRIFNAVLTVALLATLAYKVDSKKAAATTQPSQPQAGITLLLPPPGDPRVPQTCGFIHQGLERCLSEEFNNCRTKGDSPETCRNLDSLKTCYQIHNELLMRMAENLCQEHMDTSDPCQPRVTPEPADPCDDDGFQPQLVPIDPRYPTPVPLGSGKNSSRDLLAGLRNKRRFNSMQSERRIRPN